MSSLIDALRRSRGARDVSRQPTPAVPERVATASRARQPVEGSSLGAQKGGELPSGPNINRLYRNIENKHKLNIRVYKTFVMKLFKNVSCSSQVSFLFAPNLLATTMARPLAAASGGLRPVTTEECLALWISSVSHIVLGHG